MAKVYFTKHAKRDFDLLAKDKQVAELLVNFIEKIPSEKKRTPIQEFNLPSKQKLPKTPINVASIGDWKVIYAIIGDLEGEGDVVVLSVQNVPAKQQINIKDVWTSVVTEVGSTQSHDN